MIFEIHSNEFLLHQTLQFLDAMNILYKLLCSVGSAKFLQW